MSNTPIGHHRFPRHGHKGVLRGLVLGKFMPPHNGHRFLVDFARHCVDELAVVVGTLPDEPIPGGLRYRWMQELFPTCQVLHLDKVLPQYPHESPEFWSLWRESLHEIVPWPVNLVFASEDYGPRLAQELGAQFWPLDLARQTLPVSGTAIRAQPLLHWQYLPDCVRPYFLKRVAILGPESSGKSQLAQELACNFSSLYTPEYAEILLRHLHAQGKQLYEHDLFQIAQGQIALKQALSRQADKILFCDTDLLTTALWSEELYGRVAPELEAHASAEHYDLTLVCAPDLPWVADSHRLRPETRERFFARCCARLEALRRPYTVIRGQGHARLEHALKAVWPLLREEEL